MSRLRQRAVALPAALCLGSLFLTGIAQADAPSGTTLVNKTGGTVTVVAGVGRDNSITIQQTDNEIRVRDTGDTVATSAPCRVVDANEAACPAAGTTEVVAYAGDEDDTVSSSLATVGTTLIGASGNDTLAGGPANDTLKGEEGNDTIHGGGGNDTLGGGSGNDSVSGDEGNDSIDGDDGVDMLNGGAGNDVVNGGNGVDRIFGGAGNDVVDGGAGNDIINVVDGVRNNDAADGGAGTDNCFADQGDTLLHCP